MGKTRAGILAEPVRTTRVSQGMTVKSQASVLIVEDDPDLRDVYADALAEEGYAVRVASEGGEALTLLRQSSEPPCVLLLDLRMPGMSGWELAARLRESARWKHVPIVVVAAHYLLAEEGRRLGAAAWLQKPVPLGVLVNAVDNACRDTMAREA
jgi:CheY-like chemotaxis protein